MFYGYYAGDYNEVGTDNIYFSLLTGELEYNEDTEAYYGNAELCCIDFNIEAITSQYDKDHAVLPCGTYTVNGSDYAAGTINADDSYVIKVVNDVVEIDEVTVKSGTVTISEASSASSSKRKISIDIVLSDDTPYSFEYEGYAVLSNTCTDSKLTNLFDDVNVTSLCCASMANMGNLDGSETTETWVFSIGDKYYDLTTDYGPGESILLYVNLEPGLDAVPAGHFDTFANLMDEDFEGFQPNTLISGITFYGLYMGCWYTCPARTQEASLAAGTVDITPGENNGDGVYNYTISGNLTDAYGKEVKFSYSGPVEMMYYEVESYSLKSSSNMIHSRKAPVRIK